MSRPDADTLKPLARRDGEPVFDEPWQAQALGLAFSLVERGVFTPGDWSKALGAAHRGLIGDGAPDTPRTYYEAVAAALETLLGQTGACPPDTVEDRAQAWRRGYLNTPHGQPVELAAGQGGEPGRTD